MTEIALVPRTAFQGLLPAAQAGGVALEEHVGFSLATLIARRNSAAELAERVRQQFGIELPIGPRRAAARGLSFLGTGVGTWLVLCDNSDSEFVLSLKQRVGDAASVSDQSDAYGILRMSGPNVRDALCKVVPVDLHPRAFQVGDVAVTSAGHMDAILWRLDDLRDGSSAFEIAVYRSLATTFTFCGISICDRSSR